MNQRQLQVFVTIAEVESIKKAAESLFISEPAVSKTLKELENELGTPFFDRLNGRLYLNTSGKIFLSEAKKLLAQYTTITELFSPDQKKTPLKVGASLTYGETLLIPALEKFHALSPETPVAVTITNAKSITQKIWDNELDLAITAHPIENPRFNSLDLGAFPLLFAGQEKFLPREKLSMAELAKLPLLLRENGSSFYEVLQQLFTNTGLPLTPLWRSASTETLIKGAVAGFGVTLLPAPFLTPALRAQLKTATIRDHPLEHRNYLVYLRGKERQATFHTLLKCLNS